MFSTPLCNWLRGGGGGGSQGIGTQPANAVFHTRQLVHNLLMQFFTIDSSKIKVFETYFFDIVIT